MNARLKPVSVSQSRCSTTGEKPATAPLSREAVRESMRRNAFEETLAQVPKGNGPQLLHLLKDVGVPQWLRQGLENETQHRSFQWVQNVLTFLDPGRRGQALKRVKSSLVSDPSETVSVRYRNVTIRTDAPPEKQRIFDAFYERVIGRPYGEQTEAEVERVMQMSRVTLPGNETPVHVDGTVLIRPGLGNVAPSAPYVFRMAQHADKVVLAYTNYDSNDPKAQLRPLTEFGGVKVPEDLQGKLFAIGTPEHWVQPATAGAGQLISELEALRTQAKEHDIDASKISFVGISQGGLEGVLARQILAAYGFPDVIQQLVTVGSPMRGSWLAFKHSALDAATRAVGFRDVSRVSRMLTADEPENRIAEFMRFSIDLTVTGGMSENFFDLTFSPSKQMWVLCKLAQFFGLGNKVGDGLVDGVTDAFIRNPESHLQLEKLDHFALLADPASADASLEHLAKPRHAAVNPLEIIAYGTRADPCR